MDPTVVEETEQPESVTDAQADADMMAGFEGATTQTAQPTDPPPADEDDAPASPEPPPDAAAPAPKYRQVTDEEWAAMTERIGKIDSFGKQVDTAFGKLGGLERTLREMQAATPAGQAVQLSEDDLSELKADFPELTNSMIKGLNRALSKMKGTAAPVFDEAKLDTAIQDAVAKARAATLHDVMDSLDDGWRETVRSPEFQAWLSQKSEDERKAIVESDKPAFVHKTLKTFRSDLEAAKAKAAPTPKEEPPADPNEARRRRLRSAVQPKAAGDGAPATDDEEALMMQGWKQATGG